MILVVNLNPSLDKIYSVSQLLYGQAVRAVKVQNTAGGKGTHAANVIHILGEECTVTGFLGGSIGSFIAAELSKRNIRNECIPIKAETRACLNIADANGKQTEVLEPGPVITDEERNAFILRYKSLLPQCTLVAASGSLPQNVGKDFYRILIELAKDEHKPFLLDTSGIALQEGIKARPYFIKPNKDETEALTGRKITSFAAAEQEVRALQQQGIELPAISLGKEGSILAYQDKVYHAIPPKLTAINAVGSGDAYVAGLAAGLAQSLPITAAIRLASACGTANVLEAESGFVQKDQVAEILKHVKIVEL